MMKSSIVTAKILFVLWTNTNVILSHLVNHSWGWKSHNLEIWWNSDSFFVRSLDLGSPGRSDVFDPITLHLVIVDLCAILIGWKDKVCLEKIPRSLLCRDSGDTRWNAINSWMLHFPLGRVRIGKCKVMCNIFYSTTASVTLRSCIVRKTDSSYLLHCPQLWEVAPLAVSC